MTNILKSQNSSRAEVIVLTDRFEYQGWDQVIPIQPEQVFFYDEMKNDRIQGATVLEVGVGSGVLSIQAAKQGAKNVVALDINARARNIAGFNATVNNVHNKLDIRHGSVDDIFAPVAGERFDYIISNPPFEPTPNDTGYYLNSAAGIYGLDFLDALFSGLDNHLTDNGYAQIITMAPGTIETPFLLTELFAKHFPNQAIKVSLDHQPIGYDDFVNRFVDIFGMESTLIDAMKKQALTDGVTHIHMCMIHLIKGEQGSVYYEPSSKLYENWTTPLGKEQPTAELSHN
jgi:methylase of polypeptide subunit release factors